MSSKEHVLVKEMAKFTMFNGTLNDVQIKNLKLFFLGFFDGITEFKMEYDLNVGQSIVNYELDAKNPNIKYDIQIPKNKTWITYSALVSGNTEQTFMEKRTEALENAVANLLWSGIKITLMFNGTKIYESKDVK